MSKIYDKTFKIGVLFSFSLFVVFNFLSYFSAYIRYREFINKHVNSKTMIAPFPNFPLWGFPFKWDETYFNLIISGGGILNLIVLVLFSFMLGFLFKFINSKITQRRYNQN